MKKTKRNEFSFKKRVKATFLKPKFFIGPSLLVMLVSVYIISGQFQPRDHKRDKKLRPKTLAPAVAKIMRGQKTKS